MEEPALGPCLGREVEGKALSDQEWSKAKAHAAKLAYTRAQKKSGSVRAQWTHLYPECVKLKQEGWTTKELVKYMGPAGGPKSVRGYNIMFKQMLEKTKPKSANEVSLENQGMLEWSFEAFRRFFLKYSGYHSLPPHQEPWIKAFLREDNLLLNVPPGHGKSTLFMVWIPIWLIVRNRNVQILMVSASSEDAATWALEVAGQLEHNQALVADFGRFTPETVGDVKWTPGKGVFSVLGRDRTVAGAQFTMESRGMTGRVLGRRADFILVDDPTKQEDAQSELARRRLLEHLQQQVFTRAEPEDEFMGGRIAVIGQRVHLMDCYGVLESQIWENGPQEGEKVWHNEKYPAVLDWQTQKTLWPEKWTWKEIQKAYARVGGKTAFSTMYQQEPLPEGSGLITQEWLNNCKDWNRPAGRGPRGGSESGEYLPIVRVLSIDPSPTKNHGVIVGDLLSNKEQFVFSVTEVHRLNGGVRPLKMLVDEIMDRARPDYLVFEESTFIAWFKEDPWFQALAGKVNYVRHHTGVNKNSLEYGVQSLATDFEFGRISLPYGDEDGKRMTDLLGDELLQYPYGELYDLAMALWFVKFNYKGMMPRHHLPTRIRGKQQGGWSWMSKLREKKESEDKIVKRYREERARLKREEAKVG